MANPRAFAYSHTTMSGFCDSPSSTTWEDSGNRSARRATSRREDSHRREASQSNAPTDPSGVFVHSAEIIFLQFRIILNDLVFRLTVGQPSENVPDGYPQIPDAGLAGALPRLDGNARVVHGSHNPTLPRLLNARCACECSRLGQKLWGTFIVLLLRRALACRDLVEGARLCPHSDWENRDSMARENVPDNPHDRASARQPLRCRPPSSMRSSGSSREWWDRWAGPCRRGRHATWPKQGPGFCPTREN